MNKKQAKLVKTRKRVPPRSTKTKLGRAPGLDLKEISKSENSLQPFWFSFGYTTVPAMLPPYWGIPKLPMALSWVPLIFSGDVTLKLFFSTTNLAFDMGVNNTSNTTNPRKSLSADPWSSIFGEVKKPINLFSVGKINIRVFFRNQLMANREMKISALFFFRRHLHNKLVEKNILINYIII